MKKRILVADDHLSVLRGIRAALEAHPDLEVCGEAVDGQEAVDKASELHPDLVILDLAMPRLDGLKAAQAIHKRLPYIPILLHTLYVPDGHVAEQHGISKVADKSKPGALLGAIEELLHTKVAPPVSTATVLDESSQLPPPVASSTPSIAAGEALGAEGTLMREDAITSGPPDVIKAD